MEDEVVKENTVPVGGEKQSKVKGLYAVLGVLCVVIVGLVVGIVVVNVNRVDEQALEKERNDSLIDTSEAMAGWEGEISDSTRAAILTDQIEEKLSSDPNYNPAEAVAEYENIYSQATGDLKVYVALQYAEYIYNTFGDVDRAIEIVRSIENETDDTAVKINILRSLRYLYGEKSDAVMVGYYDDLLAEYFSDNGQEIKPYD